MDQYHEPYEVLDEKTRDLTRAFKSLIEEFEAVDWYNQRMAVTSDESLKSILKHNRDEELEHACMALEYLRRRIPELDTELRENLFKEGPIGHHEEGEEATEEKDLAVGSMKE